MNREKFIGFKVTDYENSLIRTKAKSSKMTISNYVRSYALENKIVIISGLDSALTELRRIGNNINQITTVLHTRQTYQPDLLQIKQDFSKIVSEISAILKNG